ncbi:MAG: RluA family pseudouridine synthase [Lachnospiraceae bacterium]|nr:RluA family pseudouridine synthase [Lachnospiraceae bacterium]
MQSFTIGENQAGQRLDKFLRKYFPSAGSGFLFRMMRKKNITLNGSKAEGGEILKVGDTVESFFSEETYAKMRAEGTSGAGEATSAAREGASAVYAGGRLSQTGQSREFGAVRVLYEDEDVLALFKPFGVATQTGGEIRYSLNEWMLDDLVRRGRITQEELRTFHPSVANRLDRNTTGLVLCGISLKGSQELARILREHLGEKVYYVLCAGAFEAPLRAEHLLLRDSGSNRSEVLTAAPAGGKRLPGAGDPEPSPAAPEGAQRIVTEYQPIASNGEVTLLEARLITGKTHQIRAQLSFLGHPIVGDPKYGSRALNDLYRRKYKVKGQLLHAGAFTFPEAEGAGRLARLAGRRIVCPLPEPFAGVVRDLFPETDLCLHGNLEG